VLRAIRQIRALEADVVHIHVSALRQFRRGGLLLLAALPRSVTTVLTIHSGSFVRRSQRRRTERSLSRLLKRFDRIVAVNEQQADRIEELGVPPARIDVIPAFLPPDPQPDPGIEKVLDGLRADGDEKVVLMSGYGLRYYGYDTLVATLRLLPPDSRPPVIVCNYGEIDDAYVASMSARLSDVTRAAFFRDLEPPVFAFLLSLCDVYLRATDRDGDAVAIREAAFFGKQIVASDAVVRPPGVVLFATNDPESLQAALLRVLTQDGTGRPQLDSEAGAQSMLDLYRTALAV
jgi:glycosyltransferase involved in cell wall biosynthesis